MTRILTDMALASPASSESPEAHLLLDAVSWDFYARLLEEVSNRRLSITFSKGRIEIMSPSWKHERYGQLLGDLVRLAAEVFNVPFVAGGSTTFRNPELQVGIEPDGCFYLSHAQDVVGREQIDLAVDPPPDLAIEIEVSRRMLDRIDVYSKLGIPELWRFDGKRLRILLLGDSGYTDSEASRAFPRLRSELIADLVARSSGMDQLAWQREVRSELVRAM